MAVTQYTGARYVPLFADPVEWTAQRTYEPLTIVLYQGNSYTSRQYVPTGIDIANEGYWVETGNYNAQVEQYRQEVQTFDRRITANEQAIEANTGNIETNTQDIATNAQNIETNTQDIARIEQEIIDFPGNNTLDIEIMNGAQHTVTLVSDMKRDFICIDCGGENDRENVRQFLSSRLQDDKLKAVIITHFHSDHWTGFDVVSQFCDADTDIYFQMQPTSENNEYTDTYLPAYNTVMGIINRDGLKQPVVPAQLSETVYGDITITWYNTNIAYRSAYDASWGQDNWDNPTQRRSTLNNYSLCALFEAYGASYMETGDIEGEAQKTLAELMQPVTVAKHPHHLWNRMGFELFYDRLMPDFWLATDHFRDEEYISDTRFDTTYLFRYLLYNQLNVNVVTNDGQNVICKVSNNQVKEIQGYFIDKDYSKLFNTDNPDTKVNQVKFDAVLPPSAYFDNPYQVRLFGADDLWLLKTFMRGCPFFEYTIPQSYATTYKMRDDLASLWQPTNISGNIYLHFRETPTAWIDSSWRNNTHISFTYDFTMADAPKNMRVYNHGFIPYKMPGSFNNGDTISGTLWDQMKTAGVLSCELPSGRRIPLINTRNDVSAGTSGAGGDFTGSGLATGGAKIYAVKIDTNGLLHTDEVIISDGSVSHFAISDITVIG